MNFDIFLESVSKIEKMPLPGEDSQFKMSPPYRKELQNKNKAIIKNAKQSAVLALFYPDAENVTKLILILRKTYKGVHSAQIGFPGGKVEPEDKTLKDTAIRETNEEVGVDGKTVKVLKELTQIYIPPSNYYVQPFIGVTKTTPKFIRQETEVEALVEVKLEHLLNDEFVVTKTVSTSYNVTVDVPAIQLNGHLVWGATAMMLSEVKDLLNSVLKQ
ncbi:NUDIX hydrolase [Lacinutrix salivirga]